MTPGDGNELDALLEPLKGNAKRCGIFLDFDGTLSHIVDDPDEARPLDGAVTLIDLLVKKFAIVGVISGRPVAFLQQHLPVDAQVHLCGLYGLQRIRNGRVAEEPGAAKWRGLVEEGATTAQAQLPREVRVERKGISFVLHYRGAPNFASAAEEWAAGFAAYSGLDAARGRMAIEVGPFHHVDKGEVVAELAEGLSGACVIGDDVGDLPAFRVVASLGAAGNFYGVRLGVASNEMAPAVMAESDFCLSGPDGVLGVLRSLAS